MSDEKWEKGTWFIQNKETAHVAVVSCFWFELRRKGRGKMKTFLEFFFFFSYVCGGIFFKWKDPLLFLISEENWTEPTW